VDLFLSTQLVAYSHSVSAFLMQKTSSVSEGIRVTGSLRNRVVAKESCGHGNKLVNKAKDPRGLQTYFVLVDRQQAKSCLTSFYAGAFSEELGGSSTSWALKIAASASVHCEGTEILCK
jgi:hypothetical protein